MRDPAVSYFDGRPTGGGPAGQVYVAPKLSNMTLDEAELWRDMLVTIADKAQHPSWGSAMPAIDAADQAVLAYRERMKERTDAA